MNCATTELTRMKMYNLVCHVGDCTVSVTDLDIACLIIKLMQEKTDCSTFSTV